MVFFATKNKCMVIPYKNPICNGCDSNNNNKKNYNKYLIFSP